LIFSKIAGRAAEGSSYAGAALVAAGVEKLFKSPEAGEVASVLTKAGTTVDASGGDLLVPLATIAFGLVSIFMPEGLKIGSKKG
tara:strand:+ start:531 stop:782 length:252 start_codon:yes stop_codon:yes gene_type:complete